MIERVIVNPEGMIIQLELRPPFSYLHRLNERVQTSNGGAVRGKTKTSAMSGQCSDYVLLGEHHRTQLEHRRRSVDTLKFTQTIAFPQNDKLKRLSPELTFR